MPDPDRDKAPRGRRPIGWMLGIFAAAVVTGFLGLRSEIGQLLLGHWSFVRSIEDDRGTYYRLKVKLTYKGEPQDFDIVVGCNVRRITYKDGSGTYEAGLIPTVFGRRMSDGKGLVVRSPNACDGETTANGKVQPDLLPVVVVYDDADTLDYGIAYLSEDAYESPISVLKFEGATVESARRSDFDEFRRTQTNLVSRRSYWSALAPPDVLKRMNIERVPKPWAHACEGYKRFRIPESARSLVRRHWPEEKPHYWVAETYPVESELGAAIFNGTRVQPDRVDDPVAESHYFGPYTQYEANYGMPTRAGGGTVKFSGQLPAAYYPASSDFRIDYVPPDGKFAPADITINGGKTRGFAYCFALARIQADTDPPSKRLLARVDGEEVTQGHQVLGSPLLIFERDEYVLVFFRISLDSTRGDV